MAEAITMDDLELPSTESFRVVGVGATYYEPVPTVGGDGKPTIALSYRSAGRGERVELTAYDARRLQQLGAVKPWEDPKSYDEMADDELSRHASARGITVTSSGADPEQPLRQDYVAALNAYDQGADTGVLGVSTEPGKVSAVAGGGATPNVGQDSAGYSAQGKSATEVSDWIKSERPNVSETVQAADGDPATARVVLEAERTATHGDPRATVEKHLQAIIDGEGE
jgi:hypothetical protein